MASYKLTTIDNPFNPFTQPDEWSAFDRQKGYHTYAYLGRLIQTSYELSQADEDEIILAAMKELIQMNLSGVHRLVTEADYRITTT